MAAISVKNLKKYYRVHQKEPGFLGSVKSFLFRLYFDVKAVDGVSFSIDEGELVGFIGPNGAGKTTTLKLLSGLLYPTTGEVRVLGYEPFKRQVAFQKQFSLIMGQKNQLWWDLPPLESFILNKEIYEVSDDNFFKIINDLSDMLDVKDILNVQVRKLSLGQRMKCELIAALLHSPKVLFLDEPTIGLDVVAQKNMRDFIKDYNQRFKATIILTSHYMGDVKELCKRVIIINDGKILYDGNLGNIIKKYSTYKVIEVDFENGAHKSLHVPRTNVANKAYEFLSKKNVLDLTIEDPPIEEIIRQFFKHV